MINIYLETKNGYRYLFDCENFNKNDGKITFKKSNIIGKNDDFEVLENDIILLSIHFD